MNRKKIKIKAIEAINKIKEARIKIILKIKIIKTNRKY